MSTVDDPLRSRFVERAHGELGRATLADVLGFLTVRRLAPGSALARFYEAFPKDGPKPNGRDGLLESIKREATVAPGSTEVTTDVLGDLLRLLNTLQNKDHGAGDELRALALRSFDAYAYSEAERANQVLRHLMVAVAGADDDARKHLAAFYATLHKAYSTTYEQLLAALHRRPIPGVATVENFADVMTALFDGFLVRAAFEEDRDRVRTLVGEAVVPLLGALTYAEGTDPPDDRARLYFDVPSSATARYPRTPAGVRPLTDTGFNDLCGTWQGTLWTEQVLRDREGGHGPRETYLVVDNATGRLEAMNLLENGVARMVLPEVVPVGDRRRIACLYESELSGNSAPDHPSHRGGWLVDIDGPPASRLTATYFTDRSTRGEFIFSSRVETPASGFFEARAFFPRWVPDAYVRDATS